MNQTIVSNNGTHQSPIDIKSKFSIYDESLNLNELIIEYDNLDFSNIANNGRSFQITSSNEISSKT
jgi:carbonic anhydrase